MQHISSYSTLQQFETFSLQDLEAANLLERKDFKYVFAVKDFESMLQGMLPYYKVMKINDLLYTDYVTDYYDTEDFKFYIQHHNGQLNRYKVRLRTYVQSALHFFEVKFKNNKNWTSKHRVKLKSTNIDVNDYFADRGSDKLEFKMRITYSRITMLSKDGSEKLTFDLNLKFSNQSNTADFSHLCVAEVKSKTHHPHVFRQEAKKLGYRTMGMSKYCYGITQLYKHLKANSFKKTILNVQKIPA